MRRFLVYSLFFLNLFVLKGQTLYFPPLNGSVWDTMIPQSLGWCQPRIDSLYDYLQVKNTKGFVVLKNGKIVLEKYFGTYTVDSAFYWASASKSLASLITGVAQQKGFININNPVSQYLGTGWTSAPLAKENLITVKHLLKMTSGLDDSPPSPCDNEDTAKTCLLYQVDPDIRWAYHTGAYRKVQDVVSAAAGQNYNLITTNWVKNKIGMGGIWLAQVYYSTARGMARFGLLTLNKGIWNTDTVLKDPAYYNAMIATSQTMNPAYGYLWWLNGKSSYLTPGIQFSFNGSLIPNAPADMFAALGKNDQKIYVVPSQNLVVVRQGNSAGAPTFALSDFDDRLWDYINKLSCLTSGSDELAFENSVSVFPIPSSEFIHIKDNAELKSFVLQDIYGRSFTPELNGNKLNISGLHAGSYILELRFADGKRYYKKVVIN